MRRTARRGRGHIGSRGLEQITIGLLTDAAGFPLMVEAFEGNAAQATTMLPTITAFMAARPAGRRHDCGQRRDDLRGQQAGHRGRWAVVHPRHEDPDIPYVVPRRWRREHPDEPMPDGLILTSPDPPARLTSVGTRSSTTSTGLIGPGARYAGSTNGSPKPRRRWPGSAGQAQPVHPPGRRGQVREPHPGGNRTLEGTGPWREPDPGGNRTLEAKARALAGWKGYADAAVVPRSVGSLLVTLGCGAGSSA